MRTSARLLWGLPLIAVTALLWPACSNTEDGPTPTISSVTPMEICDAQGDQMLKIMGTGFSPIVAGALTSNPNAVLPAVTFTETMPTAGTPQEIVSSNVSYVSQTELDVTVPKGTLAPTDATGAPETYDVMVKNPDGHSATFSGFQVNPPPSVTGIMPATGAQGTSESVTVSGTGFTTGLTATLTMGGTTITITGVTLTGTTSFTGMVDLTTAPTGKYDLTVTNADGCSAVLMGAFTVLAPKMLGLSAIEPPFGYMAVDTPVTITGSGFVSTPTAKLVPSTGSTATHPIMLTRVAFVSATTLTAVVPAGGDLGLYDLVVDNPPSDGATGTLAKAFTVVAMPVPTICSIDPAQGNTSSNTNVTITGANFRSPATVELLDSTGKPVTGGVSGVTVTSATTITATFNTMAAVPVGAYLVRVTDSDEMTYSDFSNFVNTNPSGKLSQWSGAVSMVTPRRDLAAVTAEDDIGNKFVYAIGGQDDTSKYLDSVEASPLTKFGELGAFFTNRNLMTKKRAGLGAVSVAVAPTAGTCYPPTSYVYAIAGTPDGTAADDTIDRALVLRTKDAPSNLAASAATTGTLDAGTWYYKVAAVLSASDPENPGGETLASDEAIITLPATGGVSLSWNKVTVNGMDAVSYEIYRTEKVNGFSQTEGLLDTTTGTTYTDDGSKTVDTSQAFLPEGSLGVFVTQTDKLTTGRFMTQAAVASDAAGSPYLFVVGGRTGATASTVTSSIESFAVNPNGTLGAAGTGGTLSTGVANESLFVETSKNVSTLPTTSGDVLWTWGGEDKTGAVVGGNQSGAVVTGGAVTLVATGPTKGSASKGAVGGLGVVVNDFMFLLSGGTTITGEHAASIAGTGQQASFAAGGILSGPFSSTSTALDACATTPAECSARAEGAIVVGSGYLYALGGMTDAASALASTEQTIN